MQTPTNSGPSCRIRLARCGSHTGHLNPKASQTRTCQTVTPKNIPPANADQLQPKLPHQSCVLRIPKKTPLNRRSSRHAPVRLLPQKKTSRLQTPTKSSPICRIRVARCGSQTRHRRHAPVIMLPQKTSSMQTPTNSGPSCRIRLARCGSQTRHPKP